MLWDPPGVCRRQLATDEIAEMRKVAAAIRVICTVFVGQTQADHLDVVFENAIPPKIALQAFSIR